VELELGVHDTATKIRSASLAAVMGLPIVSLDVDRDGKLALRSYPLK